MQFFDSENSCVLGKCSARVIKIGFSGRGFRRARHSATHFAGYGTRLAKGVCLVACITGLYSVTATASRLLRT